jgi:hypothetical protein
MGNLMSAIGMSMLASNDRRTPFNGQVLASALSANQGQAQRQQEQYQTRAALAGMLLKSGYAKTPEEALALAAAGPTSVSAAQNERSFELSREDKRTDNERLAQQARIQEERLRHEQLGPIGQMMKQFYPQLDPVRNRDEYIAKYGELQKQVNTKTGDFSKNPIYGVKNGKPAILQLGSSGVAQEAQLPEGIELSKEPIKLDAGTHHVLLDPITRQQVGIIPKNIAEVARQKELGEAQGTAQAGATNQLAAAEEALKTLDQIEKHPARESATGWQSNFPTTKGSKVADFENLVEQARGGSFLTAVQQMRGLGALTEAEGKAATAAVNRMNIATSDEGFLKALRDYKAVVERGREKAKRILETGGATATGSAVASPTVSPAVPTTAVPLPTRLMFDAEGNPIR